MPYREPAAQIDKVLEKRMIRAIRIAFNVAKEVGAPLFRESNYYHETSLALLATKIFDKLPNDGNDGE